MSRPKGSKNKPKKVKEESPVKLTTKADSFKPVEVQKEWTPKPDMGAVKEPAPAEKECQCRHKGAKHYGGPKGWCNEGGCNCQEFNEAK